jgi:hypothetical protein
MEERGSGEWLGRAGRVRAGTAAMVRVAADSLFRCDLGPIEVGKQKAELTLV